MIGEGTCRTGGAPLGLVALLGLVLACLRARFAAPLPAVRPPAPDARAHVSPAQDAEGNWRIEVIKRLEKLKSLDGALIEDEEREAAKAEG